MLLEGYLTGCYVVSTEVANCKDIITTRADGVIIPQGDIDGFTAAIQDVIDHPESISIDRAEHIKAVDEKFNWAHIVTIIHAKIMSLKRV